MANMQLLIALGLALTVSPAAAHGPGAAAGAPEGAEDTRYCMRIETITGSRLERVKCWTRAEWAEQKVDVDKEWEKEGVAVITGGVMQPRKG